MPERRALRRCARRRARPPLDRDRGGRPLCAGRHRGLSVIRADECGAGEGRGRAARSSWWCRRRTASSPRWCSRPRSSPASTRSIASAARRRWRRSPIGTETIAPVAKIVGPGNAYVAAAKRLVFGKVGIDMIAGPSEVLIIADRNGNPDWIAADLLAQAEHDAAAQAILITDDAALAAAVERAVEAQLATLPRAPSPARRGATSARSSSCAISTQAMPLVDAIAPEHLEIETDDAERLAGTASAMPARSSSAPTRRRRSAIMSPARTTCCRPRARRASPRASACSTS